MIKPCRGYCLMEALEQEEVSSGGVYMPERAKDLPNRGRVLAVGEPKPIVIPNNNAGSEISNFLYADEVPCKKGDIVIYKRFVDNRVKKGGKEYLLVPFGDILAIDEED